MSKVVFQIEGGSPVTVECGLGENVLELARRANVAIDAPCSGNGSCGKCRVKLLEGELEVTDNDTKTTMHTGDAMFTADGGTHSAENCTDQVAKVLAVVFPS